MTTKKTVNLGHRIMEALTSEQIEPLIDAVGSKTLLEKIEEKIGCLDNDIVDTVRNVIKSANSAGNKEGEPEVDTASDSKFIKEWNSLWQRWDAVVAEVGDEEGTYAYQDHHWEPAYFDASAFSADIEKIAIEMVPRIGRIFDLVDEPDLYINAIREIEDAIESYPDWMGVREGGGCGLEYHTSRCILQWLWIRCKEHDSPGSAFLAKIEDIGTTYFLVTLDRNAIVSFIVEMDAAVCREIYELLAGGRFREEQENVSSPWNTIMLEFKKRYDKEAYFAQCTRDLEKNWHLGIPLVESATSSKDWHGADTLLFKTFAFCFNHYPKSDWFPETSLLSLNMRYQPEGEATKNILKLLKIWGEVSDQLGNRERAVASRLQAVLADHSDDIDAVISAFTTLRKEHEVPILDTLFRQWQDETAIKSFNRYYGKQISADTWVHWAIVAQVEGEKGTARFREKLDTWFCGLSESGDEFTKHWDELALLTVDLSTGSHRNCYSGLFVTAFKNSNTSTSLDKSRSFFVKRLCLTETVEKAFEIWKKHFSRIIPDPSTSASDYLRPVAWVKVLFDLNPDAYTGLVGQWKVNHRRRINLWKTMRNAKLPVD